MLFLLNIEFVPLDHDLACKSQSLAQKKNITYYDAVHVALCKKNKAILITQDRELPKKYKNTLSIDEILKRIEK